MDLITTRGLRMPKLGLGTFRMKDEECREAVARALGMGYRHIDTAEMYGNEEAVGAGIAESGVARGDIHVTTKVWWDHLTPDGIRAALDGSLAKLRTGYVDLYMIHWPRPDMDLPAALATLMRLQEEGLVRSIGVCNFPVALLHQAVVEIGAPVAANQIEYHVLLGQSAVLDYARAHDVAVTAYCPIAQGRLAEHPELGEIARKHGATAAQVALKWLLDQDGVAAIPKASREESQRANLEATRLVLDDSDRGVIARLTKTQRCVNPAFAPEWDPAG